MSSRNDRNAADTWLDAEMAPYRLKDGLVPRDSVICLRIEEGPAAGTAIDLSRGGVYLIGRENADLVLDDEKVSRKHAEIGVYGPDAYVLRDLASTNGTYVNGRRVSEKVRLQHWDLIRIGDANPVRADRPSGSGVAIAIPPFRPRRTSGSSPLVSCSPSGTS